MFFPVMGPLCDLWGGWKKKASKPHWKVFPTALCFPTMEHSGFVIVSLLVYVCELMFWEQNLKEVAGFWCCLFDWLWGECFRLCLFHSHCQVNCFADHLFVCTQAFFKISRATFWSHHWYCDSEVWLVLACQSPNETLDAVHLFSVRVSV